MRFILIPDLTEGKKAAAAARAEYRKNKRINLRSFNQRDRNAAYSKMGDHIKKTRDIQKAKSKPRDLKSRVHRVLSKQKVAQRRIDHAKKYNQGVLGKGNAYARVHRVNKVMDKMGTSLGAKRRAQIKHGAKELDTAKKYRKYGGTMKKFAARHRVAAATSRSKLRSMGRRYPEAQE